MLLRPQQSPLRMPVLPPRFGDDAPLAVRMGMRDLIAQAEQLPMLHLYPCDADGYAQAMAEHPDMPWHALHWLSTDDSGCIRLRDAVAKRQEAWRVANPPAEGGEA